MGEYCFFINTDTEVYHCQMKYVHFLTIFFFPFSFQKWSDTIPSVVCFILREELPKQIFHIPKGLISKSWACGFPLVLFVTEKGRKLIWYYHSKFIFRKKKIWGLRAVRLEWYIRPASVEMVSGKSGKWDIRTHEPTAWNVNAYSKRTLQILTKIFLDSVWVYWWRGVAFQ